MAGAPDVCAGGLSSCIQKKTIFQELIPRETIFLLMLFVTLNRIDRLGGRTADASSTFFTRSNSQRIMKNRFVKLGLESLESRKLCAVDLAVDFGSIPAAASYMASSVRYFNASKPADVDGDGSVSPIDALRLIDTLNRVGSMDLAGLNARRASGAEGEGDSIGSVDTNNDGSLNPIDVLVVIDALNASEFAVAPVAYMFSSEATDSSDSSDDTLGDVEVTAFDSDLVFEDPSFNFDWVKRGGGSDEEFPDFADEELQFVAVEDADFQPVYAMISAVGSSTSNVARFSQYGLLGQVIRKNVADNANLEPAAVSYFSSNFLRGISR